MSSSEDEFGLGEEEAWKEETAEERERRMLFVVDDMGAGYLDNDLEDEEDSVGLGEAAEDDAAIEVNQYGQAKKKKKSKKIGVEARIKEQKTKCVAFLFTCWVSLHFVLTQRIRAQD